MILKILSSTDKASTGALSSGIRANGDRCLFLLNELRKDGKILRIKETLATYWKLNKNHMEVGKK